MLLPAHVFVVVLLLIHVQLVEEEGVEEVTGQPTVAAQRYVPVLRTAQHSTSHDSTGTMQSIAASQPMAYGKALHRLGTPRSIKFKEDALAHNCCT